MKQSDQMLEFIDGTLDVPQEQELFEQLAAHPELRTELRHYVQIGDAVRADREAFSPPADVERRLLGGLGLLPFGSAVAGAGGAATGGLAGAALLKGGVLHLLSGFILGALLVGGGVWFALDGSNDAGPTVAVNTSGSDEAIANQSDPLAGSPVKSGSAAGDETKLADGLTARTPIAAGRFDQTRSQRSTPNNRALESSPLVNAEGNDSQRSKPDGANMLDANSDQSGKDNRGRFETDNAVGNQNRVTVELRAAAPRESIQSVVSPTEFRGDEESGSSKDAVAAPDFSPQPLVFEKEPTSNDPFMNFMYRKILVNDPIVDNRALQASGGGLDAVLVENFVAGGYYRKSASLQIGVEVGRERYAQSFFYNRGDSLVIEQRPLLGWGGLAARLSTTDLLPIPITIGTALGFSEHGGPVARGVASVDLLDLLPGVASNTRLSFPFGLEASSLVYTVNDQYFISGNWGLSGGIQLGF